MPACSARCRLFCNGERHAVLEAVTDATKAAPVDQRIAIERQEARLVAGREAAHLSLRKDGARTVQRPHLEQLAVVEHFETAQMTCLPSGGVVVLIAPDRKRHASGAQEPQIVDLRQAQFHMKRSLSLPLSLDEHSGRNYCDALLRRQVGIGAVDALDCLSAGQVSNLICASLDSGMKIFRRVDMNRDAQPCCMRARYQQGEYVRIESLRAEVFFIVSTLRVFLGVKRGMP